MYNTYTFIFQVLTENGMALLDMAAEYHCYASDITCSFLYVYTIHTYIYIYLSIYVSFYSRSWAQTAWLSSTWLPSTTATPRTLPAASRSRAPSRRSRRWCTTASWTPSAPCWWGYIYIYIYIYNLHGAAGDGVRRRLIRPARRAGEGWNYNYIYVCMYIYV